MIREAREEDRAEWFRMRKLLWPEFTEPEHRDEMAGILRDPTSTIFFAERPDGTLCGFLEAGIRPFAPGCSGSRIGYIEGWYVDPDVRRQGVGRALVDAAERWARAQGCREMASDAVLSNTISHAAHGALGYQEQERLVHFKKDLG